MSRATHFVVAGHPRMRQRIPEFVEHLQSQFVTRAKLRPGRHARFDASRAIVGPLSRKVQTHADQGVFLMRNVAHEHADLTVLDLAQTTAPLPRHADRFLALLGERRRIENDDAVRLADPFAHLFRERPQEPRVVPRCESDELLQALSPAIVEVGDALAGLACELRDQSLHVLVHVCFLRRHVVACDVRFEKLDELFQNPCRHLRTADGIVQHLLQSRCKSFFHDGLP